MDDTSPFSVVARYQHSAPVDLQAISRDLGIKVYTARLGSSISGQLMRDSVRGGPSGFAIYLNSEQHPNRQRFTHAHEIAHFILHRDLINTGLIDDTMYRSELSNQYEVQANRLAADILMPIRLVKKLRQQQHDPNYLARLFQVSPEAMKIRLDSIDRGLVNRPI
ncbi:MAG: ImmA/IrrE family metallo-endopeptidase [Variibacter sp.]